MDGCGCTITIANEAKIAFSSYRDVVNGFAVQFDLSICEKILVCFCADAFGYLIDKRVCLAGVNIELEVVWVADEITEVTIATGCSSSLVAWCGKSNYHLYYLLPKSKTPYRHSTRS